MKKAEPFDSYCSDKLEVKVKIPNLFEIAEKTFKNCLEILKKKNHDYSYGTDEFRNFRLIQQWRPNVLVEDGILVRLSDKFARICNLIDRTPMVEDESFDDTIDDTINYLTILKAYRHTEAIYKQNRGNKMGQFTDETVLLRG